MLKLEFIEDMFEIVGGLGRCFGLMECLGGNRVRYSNGKCFMRVFEDLMWEIEDGYIKVDREGFGKIGEVIEKMGVRGVKMNGE